MKNNLSIILSFIGVALGSEPTHFVLDNGLKVIVLEKHGNPVVAVQVWYKVGSSNEWDGIRGTAHFFEHMMFRGTENYPDGEFDRLIQGVGGQKNAFTKEDVTVYHEKLPASELELALKLEADRMQYLKPTQEILDTEREVVHEEYRQGVDHPMNKLLLEFRRSLYPPKHPYMETPIGIMEQLDTVSVATCQSFYEKFYAPNNAVLIVVGDVEVDSVKSLAKEYFSPIPMTENLPLDPELSIPPQVRKVTTKRKSSFDIPVTLMGFHVPGAKHSDRIPLEVLFFILSNGESSRLYKSLVRDKELALYAGGFPFTMLGPGIQLYAALYFPHVKPLRIERAFMEVLEDVKTNGITEEELTKARKQLMADKIFERYSVHSLAYYLGEAETYFGDYREYKHEIDEFNAVTSEDIKRVATEYFSEDKLSLMEISPENLSLVKRLIMRLMSLFT